MWHLIKLEKQKKGILVATENNILLYQTHNMFCELERTAKEIDPYYGCNAIGMIYRVKKGRTGNLILDMMERNAIMLWC